MLDWLHVVCGVWCGQTLSERRAEGLHYLGTAYGLTLSLFNFWRAKCGYTPVYVRLTPNELTGEHTCIMIKANPPPPCPLFCTAARPVLRR